MKFNAKNETIDTKSDEEKELDRNKANLHKMAMSELSRLKANDDT